MTRLKIIIRGAVQGVGFRPFVFHLAKDMGLKGWVGNTSKGVIIEIEGSQDQCDRFTQKIQADKPGHSFISSLEVSVLDLKGYSEFQIRESEDGTPDTLILPDISTCDDCRQEILDPLDRRYRYPFTNCTQCGPRYSIIQNLPYDRSHTTMKKFVMCPECQREYDDPDNRRFHAQPNACSVCGPQLELWNADGKIIAERDDALRRSVKEILAGKIVALKGLGGFQLIVDARDEKAVKRLRERKHREAKPFAVMIYSLKDVQECCEVSGEDKQILISSESPVVLVKTKRNKCIADNVAPGNPYLGVMLPYTPLHLLLLKDLNVPIVATSGNLSEEPMCVDEMEAVERLKGIADFFLVHNRPIERAVDDSIVRVIHGRQMVIRRARGYAPLPVVLDKPYSKDVLAVGGHLKNTVALAKGRNIFISQHIGDLETAQSYEAFKKTIDDISRMYAIMPEVVVCDEHPQYMSSQYAAEKKTGLAKVQHHEAHIFSCMADNGLNEDVFGVSWDGTGFGLDETIWGGEFIGIKKGEAERIAAFRPFPLPGGEKAAREPRRAALGFLFSRQGMKIFEEDPFGLSRQFSNEEWKNLKTMLSGNINCPSTSSVGRLFDVVAALLDIRSVLQFEGQAAMEIEFAAMGSDVDACYPFEICNNDGKGLKWIIDFDVADCIASDLKQKVSRPDICAKFHQTLTEIIVEIAKRQDKKKIVMSGGCFQNKYLLEQSIQRLKEEVFQPYWHQRVPTNDGGISLGQILQVARAQEHRST